MGSGGRTGMGRNGGVRGCGAGNGEVVNLVLVVEQE